MITDHWLGRQAMFQQSLSAQVKKLRNTLVNAPETRQAVSSALSPEQIHGAVARMREKLLRFPRQRHQSVKRGTYPVTDDSIRTLHGEQGVSVCVCASVTEKFVCLFKPFPTDGHTQA